MRKRQVENMGKLPDNILEKIYAGWLGKVIGVRHGSNVEGWSYEKIEKVYGEVKGYLFDFKNFAADDDTNGPIFFIRALEDYACSREITSEQIAKTLLNYVPKEHGFFWWGKYGVSSESTSWRNLVNGILPPRSGSVEQNGAMVAEQVGGQIFSDTWGLVAPGNPVLAAELAGKASCVTHGRNGVYGGMIIAACISAAFVETDMNDVLEAGLSVIPKDCTYSLMVRDIMRYQQENPANWRDCFWYIRKNYWLDKYPGGCHIIPNSALIVLSLLYGHEDFSDTINICNMCGWDTDCNVANAATIVGVLKGLEGIDMSWRRPINDLLICSSVVGSLNILDIGWCATYLAGLAYKLAGEEIPAAYSDRLSGKTVTFDFELPGSTHGFRIAADKQGKMDFVLENTPLFSHGGTRCLKVAANPMTGGEELRIYHQTYYRPGDFNDSRYDPCFSPILYPGQKISAWVMIPEETESEVVACLYALDGNSGILHHPEKVTLIPGIWTLLEYEIPRLEGAIIEQAGVLIVPKKHYGGCTIVAYLDEFSFSGLPDYTIDFSKERMEFWNLLHMDVSQFTYHEGMWELEDAAMSLSGCASAEAYTGRHDWGDIDFSASVIPQIGLHHHVNFRVQGSMRSYAAGFAAGDRFILYKNVDGIYQELASSPFHWELGCSYRIHVHAVGSDIAVSVNGGNAIRHTDAMNPYLKGQIGVSTFQGSHCHYRDFDIKCLSLFS